MTGRPRQGAEQFLVSSSPFGQGSGGDAQFLSQLSAGAAAVTEFSGEFGGLLPHLGLAQTPLPLVLLGCGTPRCAGQGVQVIDHLSCVHRGFGVDCVCDGEALRCRRLRRRRLRRDRTGVVFFAPRRA